MGRAADSSTTKLQRQNRALDYLQRSARQAGLALGGFISVMASGRLFISAIKQTTEYQAELSKVVGLVGVARTEVDAMGESILKMSSAVGKSPQELAKGLFFVTSAGLRGQEAMEVLEMSAKAASAGLGETKTVADAVTSAMNAYAASGLDAAKATGILVAAVREGKADASEMAGSLGQVLGIASAVGVSFDQVAASVAAMTRVGITSAEAVTSLKATLNAIYNPTSQSTKAFEAMNLSVEGLRKSLKERGLLATLQEIGTAADGNNAKILDAIPNIRAMGAVFTLLGENAEGVKAIFEALAKETGQSLETAFGEAANTAEFKFSVALAQLRVEMIKLGAEALPTIVKMVEALGNSLPAVSSALRGIAESVGFLSKIALYALPAAVGVKALAGAFKFLTALAGGRALAVAGARIHLMNVNAKLAQASISKMSIALGGIGAAIAGWSIGKAMYENSKAVRLFAASALEVVLTFVEKAKHGFKVLGLGFQIRMLEALDYVRDKFGDFLEKVSGVMSKVPGFRDLGESVGIMGREMQRGSSRVEELELAIADSEATMLANIATINKNTQAAFDYEAGINAATFAVARLNEERKNISDSTATTRVSLDFDEDQVKKLSELFDSMLPEQAQRAELESALLFVEDALNRIEQKVAKGLSPELNGIPIQRFHELRDAIREALLELDPAEQYMVSLSEQFNDLYDETRTAADKFVARRSELLSLESQLLAVYKDQPAQLERVAEVMQRAHEANLTQFEEWEKQQRKTDDATKRAENGAKSLGFTFSSAFEDAIVAGNKVGDILKGLEQDIIRIITRMMATEPLGNALTGMFSNMFSFGGGVRQSMEAAPGFVGPPSRAFGGALGKVSWVGEHGKELVAQSEGSAARVLSHSDSMRIAREAMTGSKGETSVNVNPVIQVPGTQIQVINQGGPAPEIETVKQPDGSQLVRVFVGMMTNDVARNGPMTRALKGKFGLREATATR